MISQAHATPSRACPICGDSDPRTVLQLAPTPLGDRFATTHEEALALASHPLRVGRCSECNHCFLADLTPADDSYKHHLYQTDQSPGLAASYREIIEDVSSRHRIGSGDLILDVGDNHFSWLDCFRPRECDLLAVEPSPGPARSLADRGIPVINEYFSERSVRESGLLSREPRIISMNYVFANIPEPVRALRDAAALSDSGTVISIMTGYHPAQLAVSMFDYVYHEHLSYFSCADFLRMADLAGLTVTYVRELPLKGGSIHIEMQKSGPTVKSSTLFSTMLKREAWLDQPTDAQWDAVSLQVEDTGGSVCSAIHDARAEGLPVIGYGASHSTTTLVHALGIESSIDLIIDDNPAKVGRFSPGAGVPVQHSEVLRGSPEACIIVLAWQHGPQIVAKIRESGLRGRVIIPFPDFVAEDLA